LLLHHLQKECSASTARQRAIGHWSSSFASHRIGPAASVAGLNTSMIGRGKLCAVQAIAGAAQSLPSQSNHCHAGYTVASHEMRSTSECGGIGAALAVSETDFQWETKLP